MEISVKYEVKNRTSELINSVYRKLVFADASSKICIIVVTIVDSVVAARFLGNRAISAIALAVPVIHCMDWVHDLLVSGTMQVIVKYKSRGQAKQAERAFGAILINAFFWYVLCHLLIFLLSKQIFGFFTDDPELIADSISYLLPVVMFNPICEACLCLERGFKTDGRPAFFGLRGIISNVLNLAFNLIAVLVFDGGLFEISLASYIASLIGYAWSCSHAFSKKCTIMPKLGVIKNWNEFKGYIKETVTLGYVYAVDDGLSAGVSAILNKAYITAGGDIALVAIGICNSVNSIFISLTRTIQISSSSIMNIFYSDKDYKGVSMAYRTALIMESVSGFVLCGLINLFYRRLGIFYDIADEVLMSIFRVSLCFTSLITMLRGFTDLFDTFLLTTYKSKVATGFSLGYNGVLILIGLIGMSGISFPLLMALCLFGTGIKVAAEYWYTNKTKKAMNALGEREVYTCSYILDEETFSETSLTVSKILNGIPALQTLANKASLLVEECNKLIMFVNRTSTKKISVDFRVTTADKECVITLVDTGLVFDPIKRLKDDELNDEYRMSQKILAGLPYEATYSRLVEINLTRLILYAGT